MSFVRFLTVRKLGYGHTMAASCIGYVVQAIMINFIPLLFVTFNKNYGISFDKISALITMNFLIQLSVDLLSPRFVDKIGYRISAILANALAAVGMLLFSVLPVVMENHFLGILISMFFMGIGGGLTEVVISPIVEACPYENKNGYMSLLHSFYCWGHVFVVVTSILYFLFIGIEKWPYLAAAFALVPIFDLIYFTRVPINKLIDNEIGGARKISMKGLVSRKLFWVMALLMLCAGASEMAVSQWSSAFAETGLKVSKTVGDVVGPMTFAVIMGSSRLFYAKFSERINLEKYMLLCTALCFAGYLTVSLSPYPLLSLLGSALCGFSVGVMWPGTYSIASKGLKGAGTAMFALLALMGDAGCTVGPSIVGFISERFSGDLKVGIFSVSVFPIVMFFTLLFYIKKKKQAERG